MTFEPVALFLSPAEVAVYLHISRSKAYEMIVRGELHAVRIDGSWSIPVVWFKAYVAALMREAGVEWSDDLPVKEAPTKEKMDGGPQPSRLRLVRESPGTTRPARRRSRESLPSKQSTRQGDW